MITIKYTYSMAVKNSEKTTFQRHIYTDGDSWSYDLVDLARKVETLTFDERFLNKGFNITKGRITPFKEIHWAALEQTCRIPELLEKQIPTTASFDEFISMLKAGLRASIFDFWNTKDKYIVFHSAGFDSRIISAMLAELRDEGVTMDNVHFRCHQPECPGFFEIMKREGWPEDQYSCYKGSPEDYYNVGVSDISVNGFVNYNQQMNFWHDIIPRDEEKDWNLIIGLNGEMFKYIAKYKSKFKYCDNVGLNFLIEMTPGYGEWEGQWATRFKDLIMPFGGYEYLKVASKVNPKWCVLNKETDALRFALAKKFNYNIGNIPHGKHDYSWKISEGRKQSMMDLYHESKFFKKYKKNIAPFKDLYGWDAKMWGFAVTVYEKIYE